jgi:phosphoribosylformylglycinamidine (FGAM) synthase-like enzyme
MALKLFGKQIVTGDTQEKETKENSAEYALTDQELNFILAKLRTATYTGAEFEMFYNVWVKLMQNKVK